VIGRKLERGDFVCQNLPRLAGVSD
jgi:hypothetical protein